MIGSHPRLLKAALATIAAVLGLLAAEVGLRVAEKESVRVARLLYLPPVRTHFEQVSSTPELLKQSALGYHPLGQTPGFVLNSRGFRTHEYRVEREPGTLRVVVLGDSFAFDSHGVPIAQMWHQVLGRALEDELGQEVEVISLSAPGVGPGFELRLWELEGQPLSPDLVVLAFFVGNDFIDESGFALDVGIETSIVRRSRLARLLRNVARLHRAGAPATVARVEREAAGLPQAGGGQESPDYAATYDPAAPTFDRAAYLDLERARVDVFAGPPAERFERLFAPTALVVERMAREVELAGSELLVMIIPDEAQVDDRLWSEVARRFPPTAGLDRDRPQEMLARFLSARGIAYLDLLAPMRERDLPLYKPRDTHWNASGNRLAGLALAETIADLRLLPPSLPGATPPPGPATTAGAARRSGAPGAAGRTPS